jgi:RNA-binding protein
VSAPRREGGGGRDKRDGREGAEARGEQGRRAPRRVGGVRSAAAGATPDGEAQGKVKKSGGARRTRVKARITKKTGDVRSKPDTGEDGLPKRSNPTGPVKGSGIRYLRGLGHHLDPVVQIGKEGITDALVTATSDALRTHELIKVKVGSECPIDRKEAGPELAAKTGATLAQVLGRTLLLYKRHPSKPKIELPR